MASVKWESSSISTILTSDMNNLADEGNAVSSEIDNTSNLYLFCDVELYTDSMGYAPVAGAVIELYLIEALDGTNYEDGDASIDPPATNLVGVFNMRSSTLAQRHTLRQIPIPPLKHKFVVINKTGQTLASSGNILRVLPYRYQTV